VVWEHDHRADQWFRYTIVERSRQQTRQTSRQYSHRTPSTPPLSIFDLFPATVMKAERETINIVSAVVQSTQQSPPRDGGLNWSSLFIAALWKFSRALWTRRNEEVHGATVEEKATRQLAQLRDNITTMHNQFNEKQAIILPRHRYLFTSITLENRLKGSYDNMAAWLRSVEEAIQVLQYQEAQYQVEACRFFPPSANVAYSSTDSDSTYTYQSSASVDTLSLEPTIATTVTSPPCHRQLRLPVLFNT